MYPSTGIALTVAFGIIIHVVLLIAFIGALRERKRHYAFRDHRRSL